MLTVKARALRQITLAVGLGMIVSTAVRAQPRPDIELHWQGPADCAEPTGVLDEAQSLHGESQHHAGKVIVQADVSDREDGRKTLTINAELGGKTKRRAVTMASCEESRQTAAVLIALLLDAQAKPVPSPQPVPPTAAQGATPSSLGIGVAGGVEVPTLSSVSGVLEATVGWRWGAAELDATASLWSPVRGHSHGVDVAIDRFGGALSVCYWFSFERWELGPSLGVELARLQVALNGSPASVAAWFRAAPGLRLGLRLSPALTLSLFGDLMLALGRPRFSGAGGETAVPPRAAFVPRLGISYAL